jgi:predicted lipoprotein with Yx(FWY)xxD motif
MVFFPLALVVTACADLTSAPVKYSDGIMTGANGMTLYTFDKDVGGSGKSVCNGPCAKNWRPLAVTADDMPGGDWSVIAREDGSRQWAYGGKPLYFWNKDQKPGDKTGDGFNNAWHVVKQAGRAPMSSGY